MDPVAHTLTGAALAASGLRRWTPLAAAALIVGANAPDIDSLAYFAGEYRSLAVRRGWTHGVLAIVVLPFVVTALLLAWDRLVRRPRGAAPARAGPLLALSGLAVLSHPTLDWLNNYGMRWLMPFDGRWFYGDALFIIDPWVWLGLGGAAFFAYSRGAFSLLAWSAFWIAATLVVLSAGELVPWPARALWVAGVAAIAAARAVGFSAPAREAGVERAARAALAALCVYAGAAAAANGPAQRAVSAALAASGAGRVEQVSIGPVPANPFAGDVVAVTPTAYRFGRWNWLGTPRLRLDQEAVPRPSPGDALFEAAARTPAARRFLIWSRFPYIEVEPDDGGYVVRFSDARYRSRDALGGPTVRLDRALKPVAVD